MVLIYLKAPAKDRAGKHYPLTLSTGSKDLLIAKKIKTIMEQDLIAECYDDTLKRYKDLLEQAALRELMNEQLNVTIPISGKLQSQHANTL